MIRPITPNETINMYKNALKLPHKFEMIEERQDGFMCVGPIYKHNYSVISSMHKEQDNKLWHHVSVSSAWKIPDYDVMKFIKHNFMDNNKDAFEVHAKRSNHVNIDSNCRHLWMCLDEEVFPDFTNGSGSI